MKMGSSMNSRDYIKIMLSPGKYVDGSAMEDLKLALSELLNLQAPSDSSDSNIFIYGNGRSAQYEFLRSLGLDSGANIAIQGFTCNAVVNPVLWLGLEPRYVDIDPQTFCLSMEDLQKKTDKNTKVIVLQHTFGYPGPIEDILKFAKDRGIIVLEDCAHCLGQKYKGKSLGTFGDAAIFSFGIEKMLSSRVGGSLVVNNSTLTLSIADNYKKIRVMNWCNILMWLLNPIIWRSLRMMGSYQMVAAEILNKFRILNMGFDKGELTGQMPDCYPRKLANALSRVVLSELDDLEENINHRREITRIYTKGFVDCRQIRIYGGAANGTVETDEPSVACVRFPIVCRSSAKRAELRKILENAGFYIGDWYDPVVYPDSTDLEAMKYSGGSCPDAESVAARILNLPTGMNISVEGAKMIAGIIQNFR